MSTPSAPARRARYVRWIVISVVVLALIGAGATYRRWQPFAERVRAAIADHVKPAAAPGEPAGHDHAGHNHDAHAGHDHAGHSEENSIELSKQARASIGLQTGPVKLTDFERVTTVPGIVVERRGQSKVDVTALMTGVITRINVREGEAISPGQVMFEMRLTHEELVQAQADLLRTAEELDVIRREVARLQSVAQGGAIAGKTVLERKYEQQKQEAVERAQRQALLLHGLTEEQVDGILETRTLLATLVVAAPAPDSMGMANGSTTVFQVQELRTELGQHVTAGDTLAVLTDHTELLIEGEAFESDAQTIAQAVADERAISAVLERRDGAPIEIPGLRIQYVSNRVDADSRVVHFYVTLPNRLQRDTGTAGPRRFVDWIYKPGQRMQLRIPVEQWKERIVLPVEAVAQDGVESYVFRANGDHFDRQPVHVEYRDPLWAVLANDGSVFPGEVVALSAAQQMQVALKNKAGGGIDPHAGHNH